MDRVLRNVRVYDPAHELDRTCDVLVVEGHVAAVGFGLPVPRNGQEVPADGLWAFPGFTDLHVHLRRFVTPSSPNSVGEDFLSGSVAAAK